VAWVHEDGKIFQKIRPGISVSGNVALFPIEKKAKQSTRRRNPRFRKAKAPPSSKTRCRTKSPRRRAARPAAFHPRMMEIPMFIDIGREVHELIVIRNRPMLTCLEACIGQLESREQEPAVNLLLRHARAAVQRERAFHNPAFLNHQREK